MSRIGSWGRRTTRRVHSEPLYSGELCAVGGAPRYGNGAETHQPKSRREHGGTVRRVRQPNSELTIRPDRHPGQAAPQTQTCTGDWFPIKARRKISGQLINWIIF